MTPRDTKSRLRPSLLTLESRDVPAALPTNIEQEFLERLNDARANPAAYGSQVGVDLSYIAASAPLAFDTRLIEAARLHSQDMNANNYFAHNSLAGVTPFQRMTNAGYSYTSAAESIAAGYSTVDAALAGLIVDAGVSSLGHRNQLLSNGASYQQVDVGIGIVQNGSGTYGDYYTIDGGATSDSRPYITGVVYSDANSNGRYDAGEGIGGATVTVAGIGSVTTYSTGGYAIRVNANAGYSVTISGGGLASTQQQNVTVGPRSARLSVSSSVPLSPPFSPPPPASPVTGRPPSVVTNRIAVGSDAGTTNSVTLFSASGQQLSSFTPFDASFTGGVRTASADFNNDGTPDIVTGTGPGSVTSVKVFDGATNAVLFSLQPFEAAFTGGVFVAVGDLSGNGRPSLIVTPDQGGGPRVRVFNSSFQQVQDFYGIDDPSFRGGARASVGDVNGDGVGDLVVSAGYGGGPRIAGFDGVSIASAPRHLFGDFFAFEASLTNGAYVTVGDINGDGRDDVITGAGPGGGPRVSAFDAYQLLNGNKAMILDFFAGDVSNRGGVRVTAKNLDNDSRADLVVGAGPGAGSRVTSYSGAAIWASPSNPATAASFDAISGFAGGVFVG